MIIEQAREVLRIEAEGILELIDRIGPEFAEAVDLIYRSRGRVVVTGIGKSGLVGRKIVATLNSTGTPAIFLHPVEAMHGDLGMVMAGDVVLALSNSGETAELIAIIGSVKALGAKVVAMTGDLQSSLAVEADLVLDVGVPREACPLGLAPTASTTAALALGDALAVALLNCREFNSQDFKRLHPGGSLGERLSVQVKEVMVTGRKVPMVGSERKNPASGPGHGRKQSGRGPGGQTEPGTRRHFHRRGPAASGGELGRHKRRTHRKIHDHRTGDHRSGEPGGRGPRDHAGP